jgi:hypothetical protein
MVVGIPDLQVAVAGPFRAGSALMVSECAA